MKSAGAVRDGECVFGADVLGEILFEALGLGPGRNPAGTQRVENFALLVGANRGAMKGYLSHHEEFSEGALAIYDSVAVRTLVKLRYSTEYKG